MSGSAPDERDINDVFDDILLTEEKSNEAGYQDGFVTGQKNGNPEGYHLGYHRGAEIGAELGFYYGVVETFLNDSGDIELKEKIRDQLIVLKQRIETYPNDNPEHVDILAEADHIRALYKKVASQLKISSRYPETDNCNF